MKIAIISTHSYPIPWKTHAGDLFYANLAKGLDEMGHEVTFFAPEGSYIPPHGQQLNTLCSWGMTDPSSFKCEQDCFIKYAHILREQDIIHDFSITKQVAENLFLEGYKNIISTLMSGSWKHPNPQHNIVCQSETMRQRGLRGATDYENTPTPNIGGSPQPPILSARVVHDGIDTSFYTPTYNKKNYFLWLGRWLPVRGYSLAIQIAKETGIELVMAGEHIDNIPVGEYQRTCALEVIEMVKDIPNIHLIHLPPDPEHHLAKRKLIQEARALLFPVQFQEPFGLMQPEALACGTPVIGTNYGSVPEIIDNGITGFVVENDIKNFIEAINKVHLIHPALCREQAVRRFDYRVMTKNYLNLYRRVIEGETW